MNALADPFKQLVERRLWPVALLLVAALVAIPLLLAKDPEPASLPSPVAAAPTDTTESVVSLGDPAARDEVRAVLGARKDPFRPAQLHAIPKVEDSLGGASTITASPDTQSSSGGSSSGSSTTTAPSTPDPVSTPVDTDTDTDPGTDPDPVATATPEPKPTFELYSLQVRFGDVATGELQTRNVKRLTGLPGGNPAALYLGLTENRQSAVFLVDASVEVVGDGRCDPSPSNCETLVMEPGETVFLTRGDKQWELDLIRINVRKTTDKREARRSRTEVAKGGRRALKKVATRSRYRYSESTGTVRELAQSRWLKARTSGFTSAG